MNPASSGQEASLQPRPAAATDARLDANPTQQAAGTTGAATRKSPDAGQEKKKPQATPQQKRRRLVIWLLIGAVVLIAGLVWLFHWWTVGRFIENTDDAYLRADSVAIAPKISGYVLDVYVGDNQTVKAGQPLVKLDARQYQATLDQSQATIDARRADITRALADIKQQHATIDQAKAQADAARISADHAAREYDRYAPLAATGAETGEKVSDLRSTRDQARATYAANLASVRAATAQIATINAQIAQARAQLEAGEASARASHLDVNDAVVVAARDGRVGDRTVRVGQYVQPGTRMMTLVPVQKIYLVANFKETQIGRMRIGQSATLHLDALPDQDLHGVVESFAPGTGSEFALLPPENATGNFTKIVQRVPVRIRVDADAQTRNMLLPGMSVTVDVDTRGASDSTTGTHEARNGGAASEPNSQPASASMGQPASRSSGSPDAQAPGSSATEPTHG
nr:HlyD family secretion protein [Robbsia betulipollinis]